MRRANQPAFGAGIAATSLGSGSMDLEALAASGAGVSTGSGIGTAGLRQKASQANQVPNGVLNRFKEGPLPVCTKTAAHSITAETRLN